MARLLLLLPVSLLLLLCLAGASAPAEEALSSIGEFLNVLQRPRSMLSELDAAIAHLDGMAKSIEMLPVSTLPSLPQQSKKVRIRSSELRLLVGNEISYLESQTKEYLMMTRARITSAIGSAFDSLKAEISGPMMSYKLRKMSQLKGAAKSVAKEHLHSAVAKIDDLQEELAGIRNATVANRTSNADAALMRLRSVWPTGASPEVHAAAPQPVAPTIRRLIQGLDEMINGVQAQKQQLQEQVRVAHLTPEQREFEAASREVRMLEQQQQAAEQQLLGYQRLLQQAKSIADVQHDAVQRARAEILHDVQDLESQLRSEASAEMERARQELATVKHDRLDKWHV